MKDKFKGLLLGILIGTVLTGGTVFAASTTKIEVLYENLKYIVDGVEKKPTTGQGFIYQGTTYVPLRFAGEALGKEVNWDGKTKTITIGEKQGTFSYLDKIDYARVEGEARNYFGFGNTGEKTYTIASEKYLNGLDTTINSWNDNAKIIYNLNGKYKKLTGFLGVDDSTKNSSTTGRIVISGDDEVLYTSPELTGGDLPINISIDVSGVLRLEIQFQTVNATWDDLNLVLAEAKLGN